MVTALALLLSSVTYGQSPKVLKPYLGDKNDYSKKEQLLWQDIREKYENIDRGSITYDKLPEKEKELIESLEMGYGPLTQGVGCSWYCGGQMYKVESDSYLTQGNVSYKPGNAHDFDLFTAWVPDTANGVIGKKIAFHFSPLSPRVNEFVIYNGYIKNYDLFKANSRVKKFNLYINNVFYAVLELTDTTASQTFQIPPIRSNEKGKDLVLTFEIAEIYKGDRYLDVAVSEINFSGLDVH